MSRCINNQLEGCKLSPKECNCHLPCDKKTRKYENCIETVKDGCSCSDTKKKSKTVSILLWTLLGVMVLCIVIGVVLSNRNASSNTTISTA